jgi:hypothetical protein
MSGKANIGPRTCPTCGNYNSSLPRHEIPDGARYCTPLSCDSWTFTARLTKQGPKPVRQDGRADLRVLPSRSV